jgi:hypothetical protein
MNCEASKGLLLPNDAISLKSKVFKTPIYRRTYILADRNILPDLVDFCVTKDVPQDFGVAKSCFDLSSDHSPFYSQDI